VSIEFIRRSKEMALKIELICCLNNQKYKGNLGIEVKGKTFKRR